MDEQGATEVDLAPDDAAGSTPAHRRWWSRPLLRRVGAGGVVLLLSGVLSIALVDAPTTDQLDTEQGPTDGGRRSEDRRPGSSSTGSTGGSTVEGGERGDRIRSTEGGSRAGRRGGRESRRGDRADRSQRDGRGGRGGEPSTPTSTTAPDGPPSTVSGTLVLDPAGSLPALAPLSVTPDRPCPAGTSAVELRIAGSGGGLLVDEARAVAADGTWSVAALVVPAVAEVDGVAWASTSTTLTVSARCAGGPAYEASVIGLSAVEETPTFEPHWDGTTLTAAVAACPTQARLEVFVGSSPPVLDGETEPTSATAMSAGDAAGTWTGSLTPARGAGDGVWASASCLDRADGRPVWRHHLAQLEAP